MAHAGESFFTAEVSHGITGKLRMDVTVGGFGKKKLPAGSIVFGTPMSGGSTYLREFDDSLVWCAPWRDELKKLFAYCFVPGPGGMSLMANDTPFHVDHLLVRPGSQLQLIVDRGPVQFGDPVLLVLRLERIKSREIYLQYSVSYAKEPVWTRLQVARDTDGTAKLPLGGAVLSLSPGADKQSASIQVLGEFEIGYNAAPFVR